MTEGFMDTLNLSECITANKLWKCEDWVQSRCIDLASVGDYK